MQSAPLTRARRRAPGATRRASAWLLAWALVCATLWTLVAPARHARADDLPVAVTITSVTQTARDADVVTISGTVENTGTEKLYGTQVVFWRSAQPLRTLDAVSDATSGPATVPWGATTATRDENISRVTPFDEPRATFDPGATASFTVRAPLDELGLAAEHAPFLVGVRVHAHHGDSNWLTVGSARTLLPVVGSATVAPVVSVVVLTSRPSLYADGRFSDDHLAGDLAGPLLELLRVAERAHMSYAIDPNLYAEAQEMAKGYQVSRGGELVPGTGQDVARRWLAAFSALSGDGYRLPYATPDLAAIIRAGDKSLPQRQELASGTVAALRSLPLAVIPQDGRLDQAGMTLAQELKPAVILASTLRPRGAAFTTAGRAPVLSYDAAALTSQSLASQTTPVQQRQHLLASALAAAAQGAPAQVRVITTPAQAALDGDAVASWTPRRTVRDVLRSVKGSSDSLTPSYLFTSAPSDELSGATMTGVARLDRSWRAFSTLTKNTDAAPQAAVLVSRASSQQWRLAPAAGRAFLRLAQSEVNLRDASKTVSLSAIDHVVTSRTSLGFPVSMTNHLAVPVTVVLKFSSPNPSRLSIDDTTVTLEPGATETVNVRPEATSNGIVTVTGQLHSLQGDPIGAPIRVEVLVTSVGAIAWVIIVASGLVLLGTTAWRIRQVGRRNRLHARSPADDPSAHPSSKGTAPV